MNTAEMISVTTRELFDLCLELSLILKTRFLRRLWTRLLVYSGLFDTGIPDHSIEMIIRAF
jgi:hypothetical protein